MGRPTLLGHLKFRKLAKELGSRALALGTLELIWHHAYEHGEFLGTEDDVEIICDWDGENHYIAPLLQRIGFLDPGPGPGTFVVHDLYDHAPQYVQRRMEREEERRRKGQTVSDSRRVAAVQRQEQMASHSQPPTSHDSSLTANGSPPAPAPTPTPSPNDPLPPAGGSRGKKARRKASDFGEAVMAVVDRAAELWPDIHPGSIKPRTPEGEKAPEMSPIMFAHRVNVAMGQGYTPAEIIRGMELYIEEMTTTKHFVKAPQFWLGEPPKAPGWAYLDAARALATQGAQPWSWA